MIYVRLTIAALLVGSAPAALAEEAEAPKPLGQEYCFPVEDLVDVLRKFDGLKESRRDTVGPEMSLTIQLEDGEAMPERVELRDGEQVHQVPFDDHHRTVGLTDMLRQSSEMGQFCIVDPAREGRLYKDVGYQLDFGTGVRFKRTSGTHDLAEIEDGLKDGRAHYRKMVGAMGFMVPKFDHVAIAGREDEAPPRVWAVAGGTDLGEPAFELYDGARMIDIDTLEDMGADSIRIEGDYYRMSPSPDAKTVARFAGDDEDED